MIPFGIASVFMIFWGLRADRTGERVWSTALPLAADLPLPVRHATSPVRSR